MSNKVLVIEHLSKQYRLGEIGTGTLSHDLNRWWFRLRGKEDPYLKIGDINDRAVAGGADYVWSLKDVSFEVAQGEVIGIIGKNGAGKSTLLKILSQVTSPTGGHVKIKGRIASLLEVGTGFHPDLTGRENIYLNGAILGMKKHEIRRKLDEIVDFSGVAKYVDTPVKRYSSGMMVRLGFAVAAHLEPEILVVDEVLAVGDAEFQKKCIGKMKDVSGEGRTVLFVSHNMPSIRMLCTRCVLLDKGSVKSMGETNRMIAEYLASASPSPGTDSSAIPPTARIGGTGEAKFVSAFLTNEGGMQIQELAFMERFSVCFTLETTRQLDNVVLLVFIVNQYGERITSTANSPRYMPTNLAEGVHAFEVKFDLELMPGNYMLALEITNFHTGADIDNVEGCYPFSVGRNSVGHVFEYPWVTVQGYIRPQTIWQTKKIQ